MPEYQSIKESVLKTLQENLPEIQERFGIETLAVFGSVSRGEDTEDSDIDILYSYKEGTAYGMFHTIDLTDYLENLFGRSVDLVPLKYLKPALRPYIEPDAIYIGHGTLSLRTLNHCMLC